MCVFEQIFIAKSTNYGFQDHELFELAGFTTVCLHVYMYFFLRQPNIMNLIINWFFLFFFFLFAFANFHHEFLSFFFVLVFVSQIGRKSFGSENNISFSFVSDFFFVGFFALHELLHECIYPRESICNFVSLSSLCNLYGLKKNHFTQFFHLFIPISSFIRSLCVHLTESKSFADYLL